MNTQSETSSPAIWWILGLAALLILTGLGLRDPWPADEPRFAQVAREMVQSGQWLFPTRGGEYYSDKPPVFMWAIASIYWLTDNMRIAFLLPSALCSLLTVWLMHDLTLRLWDRKVAIHSSLLLLATLQFVLQAKTAQIDAMVASLIMLACYGFMRHLIQGNALGWYLLGWFAMGIGVITKGVGFLPIFMLMPWAFLLAAGGRSQLARPSWWLLAGVPCFLIAIALWVVPMSLAVNAAGDPALTAYRNDILFRQTGTRYANAWAHVKPVYYYVVSVMPVLWLPTILLLPGLLVPWGRAFRERDPRLVIPLVWIVIVLIFFSASPGKRGVYLLPMIPMFCLAVAPFLGALLEKRWVGLAMRGLLVLLAVLFIGVALAAFAGNASLLQAELEHGFAPWNLLLTIGLVALIAALLCRSGLRVGIAWGFFIVPFWLLYSTWAYTLVNADRTPAAVMNAIEDATDEEATIALVSFREQYLLFSHRKLMHFGFHTPLEDELSEAWQWQGEASNRYVLLSDKMSLECFDSSKALSVGRAHGNDWRLYPAEARMKTCARPESDVTRYDYWQPGALR